MTKRPDISSRLSSPACMLAVLWLCVMGFACKDAATLARLCEVGCDAGAPDMLGADAASADAGRVCDRSQSTPLSRRRLDMLLLVDADSTNGPWWPPVRAGLELFLRGLAGSGAHVGLMRVQASCSELAYVEPAVPIAVLPDNLEVLMDAVPEAAVESNSVIPAIGGALRYGRAWASEHPEAQVLVVVLTDISPGACDGAYLDYPGEINALIAAAQTGDPSIMTHLIGLGPVAEFTAVALDMAVPLTLIGATPTPEDVEAGLQIAAASATPCGLVLPSGTSLAAEAELTATDPTGSERRYPLVADSAMCEGDDALYRADNDGGREVLRACPDLCERLPRLTDLAATGLCRAP